MLTPASELDPSRRPPGDGAAEERQRAVGHLHRGQGDGPALQEGPARPGVRALRGGRVEDAG